MFPKKDAAYSRTASHCASVRPAALFAAATKLATGCAENTSWNSAKMGALSGDVWMRQILAPSQSAFDNQ